MSATGGLQEVDVVTLAVLQYTANTVTVQYTGLPGNLPHSYENRVFLWQSSVVGWGQAPIAQAEIPRDTESGTLTLTDLSISRATYTAGYSVAPEGWTTCASATFTVGGVPSGISVAVPLEVRFPNSVSLSLVIVTPDSVVVAYNTLRGYLPRRSGNWLGLWRGATLPWQSPPPLAKAAPVDDATEGNVAFNCPLSPNSSYTVMYFMAPDSAMSAAAILTFHTQ